MFVSCLDTGHRHSKLILYSFKKEARGSSTSSSPSICVLLIPLLRAEASLVIISIHAVGFAVLLSRARLGTPIALHLYTTMAITRQNLTLPAKTPLGASSKAQAREWIAQLLLGLNLYTQSNRVCTSWTRK